MKRVFGTFLIVMLMLSCHQEAEVSSVGPVNWDKRTLATKPGDSLTEGTTYLSVYSQIYSQSEHTTHDLTATISMRNTDRTDTVYIGKAEYFDTKGNLIRTYFDKTIFIAPMETVEIVIDEVDKDGGTGANFLFDWQAKPGSSEPLFEGVMISTSGQQGLSFATQGKKIK